MDEQPALYPDLARWFHLLTEPREYELDARHALDMLGKAIGEQPQHGLVARGPTDLRRSVRARRGQLPHHGGGPTRCG